jgi:hypothetical protein
MFVFILLLLFRKKFLIIFLFNFFYIIICMNILKHQSIQFIVMVIIGVLFNPMKKIDFIIIKVIKSVFLI